MNLRNKTSTLGVIVLSGSIISAPKTFAQSALDFAVVEYSTREDLDVLFANSTRVLEYLDGEDVDTPIFLALITKEQKESIEARNLTVQILEENADIGQFVLLYHPMPDQSGRLEGSTEKIYPISSHYTIAKYRQGETFDHASEPSFFDMPFSEVIVTPPLRTKTALQATPTLPPSAQVENTSQPMGILIIIVAVLILVIVGVSVYFILMRRRASRVIEQTPPLPPQEYDRPDA